MAPEIARKGEGETVLANETLIACYESLCIISLDMSKWNDTFHYGYFP